MFGTINIRNSAIKNEQNARNAQSANGGKNVWAALYTHGILKNMYKISAHTRCLTKLFRFGDRSYSEKKFVLGTGLITKKRDATCEKKRGRMFMLKRIKRIGAIVLGFIIALGTKAFGVDATDYGVFDPESGRIFCPSRA